jgi:hypothetical protein
VTLLLQAAVVIPLATRGYFAAAAAPTGSCGSVAECAQAAAMSAKTATDAELSMSAKITVMAAEVKTLKEALAKDEAALTSIRTANGTDRRTGAGGATSVTVECLAGQYASGLEVNPLNPNHSDSAIGSLTLHCRNAIPQAN